MHKHKLLIVIGICAVVVAGLFVLLNGQNIEVLNPKGTIGQQERQLIVFAALLSLVVVLPVFAMLFGFAWKYRESNPRKQKYRPDWDHNPAIESTWWVVPSILIFILSVVTWNSSHSLDPYRPLASKKKQLTVQVVALDWKWLFIYPEQNIASVNYVRIPTDTPVNFQITADAPMNSLWIPQLGGQIYAMPGMVTQLHLSASEPGNFHGSSANISGYGFAGMAFTTQATSRQDFNSWVDSVKKSPSQLDFKAYDALAQPSTYNPVSYYASSEPNLFDIIMMKYMAPIQGINESGSEGPGHIASAASLRADMRGSMP